MISSPSNAQVKAVPALVKKAKARREQDLFVVEGIRMFREIPAGRLHKAYVSESFLSQPGNETLLERCPWEAVKDEVFKAMSDTQTPQGILALVRQYHYRLEDILEQPGRALLMVLETLQDPGNLGTILRAGEGAGVTGVIMNRETADIYNPKVIRSTMGSIYRVPFFYTDDLKGTVERIKAAGVRLYAAHLKGENNYDKADYTGSTGFMIGNEALGLKDETAALADSYVKIPMAGQVESLNAAVAASVLMFEAARQRRG